MDESGPMFGGPLHLSQDDNQNPSLGLQVYVVEPVAMDFSPCAVEARVGQVLELPLRIWGSLVRGDGGEAGEEDRLMLSDCSHVHLTLEQDNQGVFTLLDGESCLGFVLPSKIVRELLLNFRPICEMNAFLIAFSCEINK